MDRTFRINGPDDRLATDFYVAGSAPSLAPIASRLVALIRGTAPDAREIIHDGHATFCLGDAPFAYVGAFTSHVNLGFFDGVALDDPVGLLQGEGKRMRHVKLRPKGLFDEAALHALVQQAHAVKQRELGGEGSTP